MYSPGKSAPRESECSSLLLSSQSIRGIPFVAVIPAAICVYIQYLPFQLFSTIEKRKKASKRRLMIFFIANYYGIIFN